MYFDSILTFPQVLSDLLALPILPTLSSFSKIKLTKPRKQNTQKEKTPN